MPMELSNSTLLQVLLSGSNVFALWQVIVDLLSNPAIIEDLGLRIRESPFLSQVSKREKARDISVCTDQVGDSSRIGALLAKVTWVVSVDLIVCSTWPQSIWTLFNYRQMYSAIGRLT